MTPPTLEEEVEVSWVSICDLGVPWHAQFGLQRTGRKLSLQSPGTGLWGGEDLPASCPNHRLFWLTPCPALHDVCVVNGPSELERQSLLGTVDETQQDIHKALKFGHLGPARGDTEVIREIIKSGWGQTHRCFYESFKKIHPHHRKLILRPPRGAATLGKPWAFVLHDRHHQDVHLSLALKIWRDLIRPNFLSRTSYCFIYTKGKLSREDWISSSEWQHGKEKWPSTSVFQPQPHQSGTVRA